VDLDNLTHSLLLVSIDKTILVKLVLYKSHILEVIETLAAIETGNLRQGSIARVIDCCPEQVDPFQCISKQGGICLAADYPAVTGQCVPDKCKPFFNVCTLIYSLKHSLTFPKLHYAKMS
jgi:hypothetical protein